MSSTLVSLDGLHAHAGWAGGTQHMWVGRQNLMKCPTKTHLPEKGNTREQQAQAHICTLHVPMWLYAMGLWTSVQWLIVVRQGDTPTKRPKTALPWHNPKHTCKQKWNDSQRRAEQSTKLIHEGPCVLYSMMAQGPVLTRVPHGVIRIQRWHALGKKTKMAIIFDPIAPCRWRDATNPNMHEKHKFECSMHARY